MEKILNVFGLTTLKQARANESKAVHDAVESALGEKPYERVLNFVRVCRKYGFKVVAVRLDEKEALENSRYLADREFNADKAEQDQFSKLFTPNLQQSNDLDLLK